MYLAPFWPYMASKYVCHCELDGAVPQLKLSVPIASCNNNTAEQVSSEPQQIMGVRFTFRAYGV